MGCSGNPEGWGTKVYTVIIEDKYCTKLTGEQLENIKAFRCPAAKLMFAMLSSG
jgi:hypothetical protein